ncbi:MAG TPA: diguanylate cyclase [Polyangiaceae bacterium]|nr:diguanylate cyclase [Polyangiaceae bacterium]
MSDSSAEGTLFEAAFRDAAIGMTLLAVDGSWIKVNHALCQILGYASEEEWQGRDPALGVGAEAFSPDLEQQRSLLEGRVRCLRFKKPCVDRKGRCLWTLLSVSLARDEAGAPRFFISQVQDVSEHHLLETEAHTLFEQSLDLLAIANVDGLFTRLSPSWCHVLGYQEAELTSRPFLDFVHPDDHERTLAALDELKDGKAVRAFRNRYRAKDGSYRWLDWTTCPNEDGRLFAVARDVTEHIALENQIRQASLLDELTGLSNRRGFFLLGEQALRTAARHERNQLLCYLDLDGLKEINDQLGHDQGDKALADLGTVLKHVFRNSDILARIGGDEFVTLAEGDSSAEPSLRQRIGDELRRHNESATRPYYVAASVGIAYYNPRRPVTLSELLLQADRQMYERKRISRSARPQPLA